MNLKEKNFIESYKFSTFSKFLTRLGWINDYKYNDIFSIWHRPEDNKSSFELIVPENNNIKQFYSTIEEILNVLSEYYKKSISLIIDEFNNSIHDKIKYSIKSDMTRNGLIPLDEGIRLLDNTKEMLASSLMAVSRKKKNYIGQRYDEVNEILNNIELGQTEEGSFIINIFIPKDYYEKSASMLQFDELTYTRKALDILETVSRELLVKIEEYKNNENIKIFDDIVEKGASSNFCHSISEISSNGKNDVLISIEYNNGLDKETEIKEIIINRDNIPIINKVVEYYRSELIEDDFSITGYVIMLRKEEAAIEGVISLSTWIEGKHRMVRMELNANDYLIAVNAHRNNQQIICKGTLSIQDRIARLYNVTSVLISDEDV